ncbi:unnamed protein product [Caenorhabditis sp. 36 PRJEB53466]|nr:unnamed protein product [Caenorhabditis sp. 36 PRJEB53466]
MAPTPFRLQNLRGDRLEFIIRQLDYESRRNLRQCSRRLQFIVDATSSKYKSISITHLADCVELCVTRHSQPVYVQFTHFKRIVLANYLGEGSEEDNDKTCSESLFIELQGIFASRDVTIDRLTVNLSCCPQERLGTEGATMSTLIEIFTMIAERSLNVKEIVYLCRPRHELISTILARCKERTLKTLQVNTAIPAYRMKNAFKSPQWVFLEKLIYLNNVDWPMEAIWELPRVLGEFGPKSINYLRIRVIVAHLLNSVNFLEFVFYWPLMTQLEITTLFRSPGTSDPTDREAITFPFENKSRSMTVYAWPNRVKFLKNGAESVFRFL